MSAPAKVVDTDELSFTFNYRDGSGISITGQLAIVDNASPALLYFSAADADEVYELADDGTITLYTSVGSGDYTKDTTTSQEELKGFTDSLLEMLSFGGWNFVSRNSMLSYRPIEEPDIVDAIFFSGTDASWYELVNDGIMVGYVAVDNQTGVFNYLTSSSFTFSTSMPKVEDVYIPQYK